MHSELAEVRDFLADCPPFDSLDVTSLEALTPRFVIRYLRRGASFPPDGDTCLWLIRQGAIELRTADGQLARRMSEGDVHDADCLPDSPEREWLGHAAEDTLLYGLPRAALEALWTQHPALRQQAVNDLGERLRNARGGTTVPPDKDLGTLPLATLIGRPPVCAGPDETIHAAAQRMTQQRVSALLVVDDGQLCGIVTDRDLRSRCLATGRPDSAALATVMTANPCTLPPDATSFEALLEMTRRGIHHLPVASRDKLHGLVSSTDLLRAQGVSSVYLADRIRRAADLGELVRHAGALGELWLNLARRGESPAILGRIISGIGDALASRLLALVEARLGPPPVPYAWIAYGSQGRQELTLRSDQDNALILADSFDPGRDAGYFTELARDVCDGLAACSFIHCPGDMMASNPRWRTTLGDWQREFTDWITRTDPQKARLAANLFDFRVVHGDDNLARPLRELITRECPRHESLLAHLVANTCSTPPPLGFFRNFVVDRDGEHAGQLDLKRYGILPIVDLARIHALAGGIAEVGTTTRLLAAAGNQRLSRDGGDTLAAAFEFLLALRTRHHVAALSAGLAPDNFIDPGQLTAQDRQNLRDVFLAIATQQQVLLHAFPSSLTR